MKVLLVIASLGEAATGLVVLGYPPIAARALFAAEISGAGVMMSRILGIALIGLGVACWPNGKTSQPFYGMLVYTVLVTLYLIAIGISRPVGILLWPAVVVHGIAGTLLFWMGWTRHIFHESKEISAR